jgi:hypothetical protein
MWCRSDRAGVGLDLLPHAGVLRDDRWSVQANTLDEAKWESISEFALNSQTWGLATSEGRISCPVCADALDFARG